MRLETKNHYKYCWIWYIVHVLGMIFYTCCCRVNVLSQIRTSRIRRLLPLGRGVYLEITGAEFPSVPTHHRPHQDNTSTEPSGVFLESSANRTIQQIQIQYTVGGTSGTNIGICSVSWTAGIKRYNFSATKPSIKTTKSTAEATSIDQGNFSVSWITQENRFFCHWNPTESTFPVLCSLRIWSDFAPRVTSIEPKNEMWLITSSIV